MLLIEIEYAVELKDLIESDNIMVSNIDVMGYALDIFSKSKLDFIDSLLCSYAEISNATIYTFDKKTLTCNNNE